MKTILVSGSDTDAGKTRIMGAIARAALKKGINVQIVKPYQSGIADLANEADAVQAAKFAGGGQAITLRSYAAPLGPLCAALDEGKDTELQAVLAQTRALPPCGLRLLEGAGGLAVPLDRKGTDWADFAQEAGAQAVCLVVADRLGAIHQARTVFFYAQAKGLKAGVILNEVSPSPLRVRQSNRQRLADCGVPLWGELGFNREKLEIYPPLKTLIGL